VFLMRVEPLALTLSLALLGGCGVLGPKLQSPQLNVVNVEILHSDLLQQQLRVRMHVQNPNDRVLEISGITYRMEIAGDSFAHGESQRDFDVPALGSTDFDVNVSANAAGALMKLLGSGRKLDVLDYRLVGEVTLAKGFLRRIPFEEKGQIKLR
jgi:LEA14-like dessication related protein